MNLISPIVIESHETGLDRMEIVLQSRLEHRREDSSNGTTWGLVRTVEGCGEWAPMKIDESRWDWGGGGDSWGLKQSF